MSFMPFSVLKALHNKPVNNLGTDIAIRNGIVQSSLLCANTTAMAIIIKVTSLQKRDMLNS